MTELLPGANAALPPGPLTATIRHGILPGADIDVSAFLTAATGKVRGDADMVFYAQPSAEGGAVRHETGAAGETRFALNLAALPASVEKIVLTATIHENKATFGALSAITIEAGGVACRIPCAGKTETALILAEIYRRGADWKIRVVGQGFNGGLAPLATHLGVDVSEDAPDAAPAPAAAPAPTRTVSLEKKLVSLEKKAPELVSLVKKVQVSLEKKKVARDRAKVALVLDISGSMSSHYKSGKVDILVRRVMALGYRLDDDGQIDVFPFGENIHDWGPVGINDYKGFVPAMLRRHPLEGGTRYGRAIERVRAFYRSNNPEGLPVFVMFVTDGSTDDKSKTERELRDASREPLFWKFMGIVADGRYAAQRLEFLEKLDDLKGREVDNADFFQVEDPAAPSDEEMFDKMLTEYGAWQSAAAAKGILKS
ncbi:VWA domain-containing protein [Cereibacter sphaeroides]|uniref:VWA domain-containing protein n=1 Tax=Cereibacter sphaeroides TaxID=1063 RepID=UPI001F19A6CB|nr:VWA domain-containing protein [Cereibacter sphaeroides]MCE6957751.1 VWA domain-containing protein [Cereibacter sphaeroides]MCE6971623.1 VWA domain-containing protein [Cereibacter sphaeroides]